MFNLPTSQDVAGIAPGHFTYGGHLDDSWFVQDMVSPPKEGGCQQTDDRYVLCDPFFQREAGQTFASKFASYLLLVLAFLCAVHIEAEFPFHSFIHSFKTCAS